MLGMLAACLVAELAFGSTATPRSSVTCCMPAGLASRDLPAPATPSSPDTIAINPESLKRARETAEEPMALKLDVLAGPIKNLSYTTEPGIVQVPDALRC